MCAVFGKGLLSHIVEAHRFFVPHKIIPSMRNNVLIIIRFIDVFYMEKGTKKTAIFGPHFKF